MLQSLIVDGSDEDKILQRSSIIWIEHLLVSVLLMPSTMQGESNLPMIISCERGRVLKVTIYCRILSSQALHQMSNRHSRRYAVRIYDHIWNYSFNRKGKIFLAEHHPAGPFLTVSWSKFIANLGNFDWADLHFGHSEPFVVLSYYNLLDMAKFSPF